MLSECTAFRVPSLMSVESTDWCVISCINPKKSALLAGICNKKVYNIWVVNQIRAAPFSGLRASKVKVVVRRL